MIYTTAILRNVKVEYLGNNICKFQGKQIIHFDIQENLIYVPGFKPRLGNVTAAINHAAKKCKSRCKKHKLRLWNSTDRVCYLCKDVISTLEEANIDHIIPRSKGGSNHQSNIKLVHITCNRKKDNIIPTDKVNPLQFKINHDIQIIEEEIQRLKKRIKTQNYKLSILKQKLIQQKQVLEKSCLSTCLS